MCIKAIVAVSTSVILIILVIIVIIPSQNSSQADNQGSNVSFSYLSQPSDFEVTCEKTTAYFPCEPSIETGRPKWIINNNRVGDELPNNHVFNGTMLIITNITPEQNNSLYQCVIEHGFLEDGVTAMKYKSSEGRLIIKQCNSPNIQCIPTYYLENPGIETLKSIFTNITTDYYDSTSDVSYNLTYHELNSGKICYSKEIRVSNCPNGVCNHKLNFPLESDHCSSSSDINITVALATNSKYNTYFTRSSPIKIDAINKFVNISWKVSDSDVSIKCTFINQSVESEKNCIIEYNEAPQATSDCRNSSMSPNTRVSGSNSGSHSIDVSLGQFSVSSKICFCVTASLIEPKNVTVIVEGNRSTSDSGYLWIEFVSLLLVTITCKFLAPV